MLNKKNKVVKKKTPKNLKNSKKICCPFKIKEPIAYVQIKRNNSWIDIIPVYLDDKVDQEHIFAKQLGNVTAIKLRYISWNKSV